MIVIFLDLMLARSFERLVVDCTIQTINDKVIIIFHVALLPGLERRSTVPLFIVVSQRDAINNTTLSCKFEDVDLWFFLKEEANEV